MARRTGLFLLALALALFGTGAVFVYVSRVDARAIADQQPVEVLVATGTIEAGMSLEEAVAADLLERKALASNSVPAGALSKTSQAQGRVTVSTIYPGEILLSPKLVEPQAVGGLDIPADLMAVSVELEDPQRVAGFVLPGSEVAIFDTYEVESVNVNAQVTSTTPNSADVAAHGTKVDEATRMLLPRVPVIAVGQTGQRKTAQASATDEEPVATTVLTVAVKKEDAERLVHAAQTGRLYFALLTKNSATGPTAGVDNSTLFD